MKTTFYTILTSLFFLFAGVSLSFAQPPVEEEVLADSGSVKTASIVIPTDSKIALKGVEIDDSYVYINYELPYSGMVELKLFDGEGEKIYANQYTNQFGENRIVLRRNAFTKGNTYAYQLNYKTDEVKETLMIPTAPEYGSEYDLEEEDYSDTYEEYPLDTDY